MLYGVSISIVFSYLMVISKNKANRYQRYIITKKIRK